MGGFVLYVLLAFLGPYFVLALLPRGWIAFAAIGLAMAVCLAGLVASEGAEEVSTGDAGSAMSYGLAGLGAAMAALVQGVRAIVSPPLRLAGGYGLVVVVAPVIGVIALAAYVAATLP